MSVAPPPMRPTSAAGARPAQALGNCIDGSFSDQASTRYSPINNILLIAGNALQKALVQEFWSRG